MHNNQDTRTNEVLHVPPLNAAPVEQLPDLGDSSKELPTCHNVVHGIPEMEPFPVEALPSVIRDYALDLASVYNVSVKLPALVMLGALSGAIGKSRQTPDAVQGRTTRANLYMVLSLNSGAGKSISTRTAKPFTKFESEATDKHASEELPRLKVRQSQLEKELKQASKKEHLDAAQLKAIHRELDQVKRELQKSAVLSVGNFTTTGLGNELARTPDETLWVYSTEGGQIVDVMLGPSKKRAAHIEPWLNGYSGEGFRQTRARSSGGGTNSIDLKDVCLSALIMVQPSVAKKLQLHPDARDRGLLARMLTVEIKVTPVEDTGHQAEVSSELEGKWAELISGLLQKRLQATEPTNITCTPEAKAAFRAFHNETTVAWTKGDLHDMDKELSRWRENAIKLALVFQAASDPAASEITEQIATDAIAVMRWIGIGILHLCENRRYEGFEKRALQLEQALKKGGGSYLSYDLARRHGFSLQEAQQLAGMYPALFTVERIQSGGRPGNLVSLM